MPNIRKPFFVIPHPITVNSTGNEQAGYPASNLTRHNAMGLVWKSTGPSSLSVTGHVNIGADVIDFVSLIGAGNPENTKIRVRLGDSLDIVNGVSGTPSYDSGVVDIVSPAITTSTRLYHSHLELPSFVVSEYWRIDISGHTGDFQASALVLGRKIEPLRFYDTSFEYGHRDLGSIEVARNGVVNQQPGGILRTLAMQMSWMSETEFEASFRALLDRPAGSIVYCCFDPEPTVYRQYKSYLGWLEKPVFTKGLLKPGFFSQEWNLISLI